MPVQDQFCTFYLEGLFFGIEVHKVQEVLRHQSMTRVPTVDPVIGGLINLRGQIVTALDLRRRLGLPERTASESPMNVVVRGEDGAVSLLVDEIGDVVEVEGETFESPPDTLAAEGRRFIVGVHKLKGQLLHVLNAEAVLAA